MAWDENYQKLKYVSVGLFHKTWPTRSGELKGVMHEITPPRDFPSSIKGTAFCDDENHLVLQLEDGKIWEAHLENRGNSGTKANFQQLRQKNGAITN